MLNNVNISYSLTVVENITLTLRGHDFTNEGGAVFGSMIVYTHFYEHMRGLSG